MSGDIIHKTGNYDRELINACEMVADLIEDGNIDDILGKAEPCLDDVREEARRVFGEHVSCDTVYEARNTCIVNSGNGRGMWQHQINAPTIASAYAALRALPSGREK